MRRLLSQWHRRTTANDSTRRRGLSENPRNPGEELYHNFCSAHVLRHFLCHSSCVFFVTKCTFCTSPGEDHVVCDYYWKPCDYKTASSVVWTVQLSYDFENLVVCPWLNRFQLLFFAQLLIKILQMNYIDLCDTKCFTMIQHQRRHIVTDPSEDLMPGTHYTIMSPNFVPFDSGQQSPNFLIFLTDYPAVWGMLRLKKIIKPWPYRFEMAKIKHVQYLRSNIP